jgi:type I restriction enzyme S subunit
MECGANDAALVDLALGPVPEDLPNSEMAEQIELPAGWRIRRLGELIARPQYGLTASAMDDLSGPRFLRITDIQKSGVDWTTVPSCDCDKATLERLKLLPGDVVVARIGATTGKAHLIRDRVDAVFASYLIRLRANDGLEPEFLECFTNSAAYWRQIDAVKGGRLKQGVNIPLLESLELALPPLPEQRAIACVLRTVQKAKEACERVLAATRQLKQSLLQHLFTYGPVPFPQAAYVPLKETEAGPMPEHWSAVSIREIETFMQYGTSSRCESGGSGLPVLRIPNVGGGRIDTGDLKYLAASAVEIERHLLQRGDLLFVRTNGVRENVGRCAVYLGSPVRSLFASYLIRARLAPDRALPEFVQLFTETNTGRASFTGRASGAADGKFNINTQTIRSTILPLPPLSEQREIVAQVSVVEAKLAAEESRHAALAALFQSLLHHLMTGQVRVPFDCGGSDAALASRGARSRT